MARRLSDVVAALDVAVGPDATDLRSLPKPEASWPAALEGARPPSKVAWSPTLGFAEIDAEVLALCRRAVDVLSDLGTEVVEVGSVFDADPIDQWLTLAGVYNLRTHADLVGTPAWDQVDPVLRMVLEGAAATIALDVVPARTEPPVGQRDRLAVEHDARHRHPQPAGIVAVVADMRRRRAARYQANALRAGRQPETMDPPGDGEDDGRQAGLRSRCEEAERGRHDCRCEERQEQNEAGHGTYRRADQGFRYLLPQFEVESTERFKRRFLQGSGALKKGFECRGIGVALFGRGPSI